MNVQYNLKQRCCSEKCKSFTIPQHDPKVIFPLSLHWFVLYLPYSIRMCVCGCEVKQPQVEKTCSPLFIMKKLLPFGRFEARTKVTGGLTCCFSLCSGCVLHAILHEIHLITSFESLKKVLQNWLCI